MLIGIDVGGTNLVAAKITDEGKILDKTSIPVNRAASAEELCATLVRLARSVAATDQIDAVGIGFPGLVDNNSGVVVKNTQYTLLQHPFPGSVSERMARSCLYGKRCKLRRHRRILGRCC